MPQVENCRMQFSPLHQIALTNTTPPRNKLQLNTIDKDYDSNFF